MSSQIVGVANGIGQVEASEPILANELRLRAEALTWAVNQRMVGRPGATMVLRRIGRFGSSSRLTPRSLYSPSAAANSQIDRAAAMSTRLATRIGSPAGRGAPIRRARRRALPRADGRRAGAHEGQPLPARTGDRRRPGPGARRARRRSTRSSATTTTTCRPARSGSPGQALRSANRRLYHHRAQARHRPRGGVGVVAVAIRARELHVAKLGPASAVIVREGRMFELPPPPAVAEEDPRLRQRRVAATLGEALEIEPYTWHGDLAPGDRIALVSRNLAQVVGVEELKPALEAMRPAAAAEHLQRLFADPRRRADRTACMVVEVIELAAHGHHPAPRAGPPRRHARRPAGREPGAARRCASAAACIASARRSTAIQALPPRPSCTAVNFLLAFVPRRRAHYPRAVSRTDERESGRRHRLGLVVDGGPGRGPGDGHHGRVAALGHADRGDPARRGGARGDRQRRRADRRGGGAGRGTQPGRPGARACHRPARRRLRRRWSGPRAPASRQPSSSRCAAASTAALDQLYRVARIRDIAAGRRPRRHARGRRRRPAWSPSSDGALWLTEAGRGRVVRVDPARRHHDGRLSGRTGARRRDGRRAMADRDRRHRRGASSTGSARRGASTSCELAAAAHAARRDRRRGPREHAASPPSSTGRRSRSSPSTWSTRRAARSRSGRRRR